VEKSEMGRQDKLDLEAVVRRAQAIRARYHELETQHHGSVWTVEEDALAFLTDAGLVGRLAMDRRGRWPKAGSSGELEHKLGECIWWLAVLASRLDVDLEQAVETFLSTTERRLQ
jgi:hypothetical protein